MMFVKDCIRDLKAAYYLKQLAEKPKVSTDTVMRVAFFVFEPTTWDKTEPVYQEFLKRSNVWVEIVLILGAQKLRLNNDFSKELNFFNAHCKNLRIVYASNIDIDIKKERYDYVFYQSPYNGHLPRRLRAGNVVMYSKTCYIPYASSDLLNWRNNASNLKFFRNLYFAFMESQSMKDYIVNRDKKKVFSQYRHIEYLGYPVFDDYVDKASNSLSRVLWTPRWTYDNKAGGSHFIEYKDKINALVKKFSKIELSVRPHPLMFPEMVKTGKMTQQDVEKYKMKISALNITLEQDTEPKESLLRADILIADYSSINTMFFLTGRPIIYCDADICLAPEYEYLKQGMYIAKCWDDVERYLKKLLIDNDDYLKEQRQEMIKNLCPIKNSAKVIVDRICRDFWDD